MTENCFLVFLIYLFLLCGGEKLSNTILHIHLHIFCSKRGEKMRFFLATQHISPLWKLIKKLRFISLCLQVVFIFSTWITSVSCVLSCLIWTRNFNLILICPFEFLMGWEKLESRRILKISSEISKSFMTRNSTKLLVLCHRIWAKEWILNTLFYDIMMNCFLKLDFCQLKKMTTS